MFWVCLWWKLIKGKKSGFCSDGVPDSNDVNDGSLELLGGDVNSGAGVLSVLTHTSVGTA